MSGLGVNGTVCNAQQYNQSVSESSLDPTITCLTHGQTIGLSLIAETSLLSLLCLMILFILICRNVLRYWKAPPNGGWRLLQFPPDIYLLTLFFFDILQALGGAFNIRWARDGIVTTGSYCVAQGIVQQTGELGVALTTLLLASHTFVTALWSVGMEARGPAFGLVGLVWVFIALWVGLGNGLNKMYEAPTPYWCWIPKRYFAEQVAGEYAWILLAWFASIFMYIPVYLSVTGHLSVENGRPRIHWKGRPIGTANRRATLRLLIFPFAYSIIVLPLSVSRLKQFVHGDVPSSIQFFSASMFNLSGAINVVLFLVSKPQFLLFIPPVIEQEVPMQPISPSLDPVPQSLQLSALELPNDLEDQRSSQPPESSSNSVVQPGDSGPGLDRII
ncbi:hypothetical protein BGW80DRAFT_1534680 [Lactifluus volemus]|nr:hypothetical protein BGW80DRAFT_1534680 [Lactifluus volemus]